MPQESPRTYVGFGFGAIQAGLFLYEAWRSGNFDRLVVAEVLPAAVTALRRAGGFYSLNIAHPDRVETVRVGPVEILDPAVAADREALIEAVARATEIGTAVPSVAFYAVESPGSLHRILAAGLARKSRRGGPRAVIYAAENHNEAAEILERTVLGNLPEDARAQVRGHARVLNTVVGKMSGVTTAVDGLAPVTDGDTRAFLVEAFNRILISRIPFDANGDGGAGAFRRGIGVFEEKPDLLPFEEAKLYGHNAAHALAAYVGAELGLATIAALRDRAGVRPFLRAAFIEESGMALVERHAGVDELFTWDGWRRYADDLLQRMTNPFLQDTVERVGRDPARKLGWDDRLVGTMRIALDRGLRPRRFAFGAALALAQWQPELADPAQCGRIGDALEKIWGTATSPRTQRERRQVVELIAAGVRKLAEWRAADHADLELLFHRDDD